MEYVLEKLNKKIKLSENDKASIVKIITNNFKTYNEARANNLVFAKAIIDEVFLKSTVHLKKNKNKKDWKSNIKMCKHYMFFQTLKSFIWKNTYSGISSMFDVSGECMEADSNSNKQKAMLVDILEKMGYAKISDTVIDYSLIYGELIAFCGWKKQVEEYRRPIDTLLTILNANVKKIPKILKAKSEGKNYYTDERIKYDNPYIYAVNPANFVFDSAQFDNFDSCPKIHKVWKTPYDIINNKTYEITSETKEGLKILTSVTPDISDISNQSADRLSDSTKNNSTVEVLEHWGDFLMPDGTLLKNWHIVVVAGKYLVKFSKNPFIDNPFTYGAYLTDPETKRGISPLASILGLSYTQETLMNKTLDLQSLVENPPLYAPAGFFEKNTIDIEPGLIIEYDPSIYNESLIKAMNFNPGVFISDISFLSDLMAEISGIFPNMAGSPEKGDKTATEISVKTQGQTTRLSMILDNISQNYIIPTVSKTANLCANFKSGDEVIFLNKDNNPENVIITDSVRQAEYRYSYRDKNAIAERVNFADMTAIAIEKFAQILPLNMEQIFIWYLEQKGVENPQRFLAPKNVNNDNSNGTQNPNTQSPPEINKSPPQNIQNSPIDLSGILNQTPEVNYG